VTGYTLGGRMSSPLNRGFVDNGEARVWETAAVGCGGGV
jgi:hypothetical protein